MSEISLSINEPVLEDAEETEIERHESYSELVWNKFKRSKPAIAGGLMILTLIVLSAFAEFFSPNPLNAIDLNAAFTPPHQIHLVDSVGNFHLRPFVYGKTLEIDIETFEPVWTEDTSRIYPIKFFVQGFLAHRAPRIAKQDRLNLGIQDVVENRCHRSSVECSLHASSITLKLLVLLPTTTKIR
jgi:hypothetical protein